MEHGLTANDLMQMADDGERYELSEEELTRMVPAGSEYR